MALRAVSGTPLPPDGEFVLPSPPLAPAPAPAPPSARSASAALARLSASSISSSTPIRRSSSTAFIPWQPLTASSAASALASRPPPRPLGSPDATESATVLLPAPAQLVTESPANMTTTVAEPANLRRSTRQRAPPPPPPAATPKPVVKAAPKPAPVSRRPSARAVAPAPAPAPAVVPAMATRAKRSAAAAAAVAAPDAKRRVRVIRRAPSTATVAAPPAAAAAAAAAAARPAAPAPAPASRSRGARARRRNSAPNSPRQPVALATSGTVSCFICHADITGTDVAINLHIDACLAAGPPWDQDASDDDDDDDGERHPAAESVVISPRAPSPLAPAPVDDDDDDDDGMDLDVQDDAPQYGAPQYSERDVMRYAHAVRRDESDQALREMVANAASRVHGTPVPGSRPVSAPVSPSASPNAVAGASAAAGRVDAARDQQRAVRIRFTVGDAPAPATEIPTPTPAPVPVPAPPRPTKAGKTSSKRTPSPSAESNLVVEALKARVAELEAQTAEMPRCRICWGVPTTPVVSAVCWHVHCEACWLTALGAKKVCPQCRVIMQPEDLRRVYI
ncbi:hypothetical protein GGF31_006053 [Allomyces arbusculus]|nr:hypothetical protein GGF31_006053 [Allomyces arbusculus]